MATALGRLRGLPWGSVLRSTARRFSRDQASFVASGVAFRVALAIFPGIALLVWVCTKLLGPQEAGALSRSLSGFVPEAVRSVLSDAVAASARANPVDETGAGILGGYAPVAGLLFATWSTSGGVWALFDALNVIYGTRERRSLWLTLGLTLLFTLLALALFVLLTGLLVLVPALLPHSGLTGPLLLAARSARWILAFLLVALGLALLFRYAPSRGHRTGRFVTVGAALGALLLVLSSALYSWAIGRFSDLAATYGALSTVVSFLLWLWISFIVVLAAAELDASIAAEVEGCAGRGADPAR